MNSTSTNPRTKGYDQAPTPVWTVYLVDGSAVTAQPGWRMNTTEHGVQVVSSPGNWTLHPWHMVRSVSHWTE